MEMNTENIRSSSLENTLWKRLWTVCKASYVIIIIINIIVIVINVIIIIIIIVVVYNFQIWPRAA
jgi:hypothetical protein